MEILHLNVDVQDTIFLFLIFPRNSVTSSDKIDKESFMLERDCVISWLFSMPPLVFFTFTQFRFLSFIVSPKTASSRVDQSGTYEHPKYAE